MYIQLWKLDGQAGWTWTKNGAIEFFKDFVRFHDFEASDVERYMRGLFISSENPAVMLSDGAEAFAPAVARDVGKYGDAAVKNGTPESTRHFDVLLSSLPGRPMHVGHIPGTPVEEEGETNGS